MHTVTFDAKEPPPGLRNGDGSLVTHGYALSCSEETNKMTLDG
jgi:hypothetical protein